MDNTVVAPLMHAAKNEFLNKNRDLVACVRGGAAEIFERISAEMMLDDEAEEAIGALHLTLSTEEGDAAGDALTSSNRLVRSYARGTMRHGFYKQICLSFLRLRARGVISYVIALTPEAAAQEFQVEVDAGCRLPQAAIEAQEQQQNTAEDLAAEITADWSGRITTSAIRAKKQSNPAYAARLDQMLEEGKLQ